MNILRANFSAGAPRTNSDKVYDGLRTSIVTMRLKPGDEININTIAENLGISRSPVRDALLKLGKEGLVDMLPQKGTFVSKIDMTRVHEERFLREALEEKAIELFIDNMSEDDVSLLERNLREQDDCRKKEDFIALLDSDDAFHAIIFKGARKTMCWEIVRSMSGHYRRIRLMTFWYAKLVTKVIDEHRSLLESIRARDKKSAVKICRGHVSKLLNEEDEILKQYPEFFVTPVNMDAFTGKLF
jgi:DNA-binding GntR family transcriptional regulator